MTLRLAGYAVEQLLGSGGSGQVWRAREIATGELVALKRAHPGSPPEVAAALERGAELLGSLPTPYVVRLRDVVEGVLVLDHAGGGSLSGLLARRGCLDPGEVVTVAAPLAEALAACHAAGLVHGDVSPGNVLLTDEGMPLLTDLVVGGPQVRGTAEYVDPVVARGGAPDPAADVWALGALCHHLLAGTPPHDGEDVAQVLGAAAAGARAPLGLLAPAAPRALVEVVEQALADDPGTRPSAADLARALHRAHPPRAVQRHGPLPGPVPDVRETHVVRPVPEPAEPAVTGRRRGPARVLAVVAAVAVLALLAGGLAWAWRDAAGAAARAVAPLAPVAGGASGLPRAATAAPPRAAAPSAGVRGSGAAAPPGPAAAAAPPAAAPEWAAVLADLDGRREQAFARGEPGLLASVWAPGSAALARDAAVLQGLGASGLTATGVRHEVRSLAATEVTGDRVRLRVVDVLAASAVRDRTGAVVQEHPARAPAAFEVALASTPQGWRIAAVAPA